MDDAGFIRQMYLNVLYSGQAPHGTVASSNRSAQKLSTQNFTIALYRVVLIALKQFLLS